MMRFVREVQIMYINLQAEGEGVRMKIMVVQYLNVKKWENIMKEREWPIVSNIAGMLTWTEKI